MRTNSTAVLPTPRLPEGEAEHLTTGWEADLPASDTLLRRFLLHYAEYFTSAAEASGGRALRTDAFLVADLGRPSGFYNVALLLQPPAPDRWDQTLDAIERVCFARDTGTGNVLLWSAWPTPDLTARAWELEGHPPLLLRPPGGTLPPAAPALRIEPVRDRRGLADWTSVAVEGFPLRDVQQARVRGTELPAGCLLGPALLDDPRWRFWVGYDDDLPVSIGTLFVAHGIAQPALGVTLPQARGRGYWYGQMRERLLAEPGLLSAGHFSDDSRPGAERLGYLPLLRFTLWRRGRDASSTTRPSTQGDPA